MHPLSLFLAGTLAVTASSHAPAAHDVRLTLSARYEMQCGYPGEQPLVVRLPQTPPAHVAAAAVLVDGNPARGVTVEGRFVTVAMPKRPQILCDALAPGTLKVVFTQRAHLRNPARAGSYAVTATKGTLRFAGRYAVR